jgi:putative two-component system response regulator
MSYGGIACTCVCRNIEFCPKEIKMAEKGTILIVDDEVGPRESLRLILKPIYEIHTAADGDEALRCIQDKEIDVVTLDLKMPGMSGFEVLRGIKKLKADIEVIIVTGYGTLKNAQEAIHHGAGDFISKPFNIPDIISIVNKSFMRRRYNLQINSLVQQIKGLKDLEEEKQEGLQENFPVSSGENFTPPRGASEH